MSKSQRGFTLVELIVVIVILGILAATALPRFINVTKDARRASVLGFAGGVAAAAVLTQAKWIANGSTTATTVTMADGVVVAVSNGTGLPLGTSAGIGVALRCTGTGNTDCNGFTANYTTSTAVTFTLNGTTTGNCIVTYNGDTGAVTRTLSGDCG